MTYNTDLKLEIVRALLQKDFAAILSKWTENHKIIIKSCYIDKSFERLYYLHFIRLYDIENIILRNTRELRNLKSKIKIFSTPILKKYKFSNMRLLFSYQKNKYVITKIEIDDNDSPSMFIDQNGTGNALHFNTSGKVTT